MKNKEVWFIVGSQILYGEKVLETVEKRAIEMTDKLNKSGNLPCRLVYKITAKTSAEITEIIKQANYDDNCIGIMT